MKRMILQVAVGVFTCAVLSSCININSMNKVEPGLSLNCTQEQDQNEGDDECGASVKTELYFGMSKPDGTTVSEDEWQAFVDKAICPLFEGFTIIDALGQSKNTEGKAAKGKTKLVIIVHEDGDDDNIDKVRKAFNKTFPKNGFFKVSYPVSSSLDDDEDDDDDGREKA